MIEFWPNTKSKLTKIPLSQYWRDATSRNQTSSRQSWQTVHPFSLEERKLMSRLLATRKTKKMSLDCHQKYPREARTNNHYRTSLKNLNCSFQLGTIKTKSMWSSLECQTISPTSKEIYNLFMLEHWMLQRE